MRRIIVNTFSPSVEEFESFCSHDATLRTSSWSMPSAESSTAPPERRLARAVS